MAQQLQGPVKYGDIISLFNSDGSNSAFISTLGYALEPCAMCNSSLN